MIFYIFDVLILAGRSVMGETLDVRRILLETKVLPGLGEPVRPSVALAATVAELVLILREQGLEGLVAKRRNSIYEPGLRSGAWKKMRLNRSQDFVIAGYTPAGHGIDAVIFGYYEGDQLLFAARTRNGFTPDSRRRLFERLRPLETPACPFANLPEKSAGRWGQGLTAEKMKECRWLKPELVGRFEFVEWTSDNHLRHSRFMGLCEDASATHCEDYCEGTRRQKISSDGNP